MSRSRRRRAPRDTLSQRTFGPCSVNQAKAPWLVAAGRPSSSPARASTAAPVQTDVMRFTFPSIHCTQSSSAATRWDSAFASRSGQVRLPPGSSEPLADRPSPGPCPSRAGPTRTVGALYRVPATPDQRHSKAIGQRIAIAIAEKSADRERFREAEDIDVLELS
jgi:hypothetical protein